MSTSQLYENLSKGLSQRVVIYGTSLSAEGAWTEQLQRALEARVPELLSLVNAARSGENSRWGLAHIEESVLSLNPDAIFLEFSINDSVSRFGLSLEESHDNHNQMLDRVVAKLPGCEAILQIMNPVVQKPEGDRGHRRQLSEYQQIYRDLAQARGLLLIDHSPAWNAVIASGEAEFLKYVPDGVHPNREAYERLITPTILSTLGLE